MDDSIGLYIHIPFCRSKCYYCDFNSYSGREHLAGSYFNALNDELVYRSAAIGNRRISSIFIGGGTPSLVDPGYIRGLMKVCSKYLNIDKNAEISMESNPGTLDYDHLKQYREMGINRLSIGLQAWQDSLLRSIGRIHDRQQFVDNLAAAVKAGFDNTNADLIFGLPGQSFEDWKETLEAVTGFWKDAQEPFSCFRIPSGTVKHLSCYSLKIEEGTVLGDRLEAGTLVPADDELDRKMYHYAVEFLTKKGYRHYEISNFALPGYECRHNLIYWTAREYAGLGAGAHSYLNSVRFSNVSGIEQYIMAVGCAANEAGCSCMPASEISRAVSADSRAVSADSQAVSADSRAVSADSRAEEADSRAEEADSRAVSADNRAAEADGRAVSADNRASEADGRAVSADSRAAEADGRAVSADSRAAEADGQTGPVELFEDKQFIDRDEAMAEFMILGLRLTDGVNSVEFKGRFGERLEEIYGDKLNKLVANGLVSAEKNAHDDCITYKLTSLGLDLANRVFVEFI